MRVVWTENAEQDRLDIWNYIAIDSPDAAARMDDLFSEATVRLAKYPKLGKVGRVAGTRELLPHENYRLVYEVDDSQIWIIALTHTSRPWPLK